MQPEISNHGILKAARSYIHLRTEDTGRKPTSIGLDPDLYQRFVTVCEDYVKHAGILGVGMVKEEQITYYGVDFFPDSNGIEAF